MKKMARHISCGGELRIMVNLFLNIPFELESRLSKKNIRRKDVKIEGAGWPESKLYCTKCGFLGEKEERG